ncbi:hypothetical protein HK100_004895 [Physocladia obscura]|uniref:Uncharacterized protein n=1 Tax=Physocladia obscura TaxID=109957 RepID=A0AAD5TC00_9FUNG|nr:hypothetical protein HK100_004895 [Physocladia obscura]
MADSMPRIAIEERADLLYVKKVLLQAANTAADSNPAALEKAKFFIDSIFDMAAPNLAVNGVSYSKEALASADEGSLAGFFRAQTEPELEPFDEQLRDSRENLMHVAQALRTRVAKLRTEVPIVIASETEQLLLPAVVQVSKDSDERTDLTNSRPLFESSSSIKRAADWFSNQAADLQKDEKFSVEIIQDLNKTIPSTVSKWKRARTVVEDMCKDATALGRSVEVTEQSLSAVQALKADAISTQNLTPRKARAGLLKILN